MNRALNQVFDIAFSFPSSQRQNHSIAASPGNREPRSQHTPPIRHPVDGDGGGGGGGQRDVGYTSNGGHRGNTAHKQSPRMHNTDKQDMDGLSEYTAVACGVQDTAGGSTEFFPPGSETAEQDDIRSR